MTPKGGNSKGMFCIYFDFCYNFLEWNNRAAEWQFPLPLYYTYLIVQLEIK